MSRDFLDLLRSIEHLKFQLEVKETIIKSLDHFENGYFGSPTILWKFHSKKNFNTSISKKVRSRIVSIEQ
jgi:hypothetical protein